MKSILLVLLLICCKLCFPQNSWRLDLEGKVIDQYTTDFMEGVQVELSQNNIKNYQTITDEKGLFYLHITKEGKYQLSFKKKDYFTKTIDVEINGVENQDRLKTTTSSNYTCQIEVSMYQFVEGINASKLTEPIGSIFFDKEKNNFSYSINRNLEEELRTLNKKIQALLIKQNRLKKISTKTQAKEIYSPDATSLESQVVSYNQTTSERCIITTIIIKSRFRTEEFKEIQHAWGFTCYKRNNEDITRESFTQHMRKYRFLK